MKRPLPTLAFVLITMFAFSACSSEKSQADKASRAMAETSCLIFSDTVPFDQIQSKSDEIIKSYGWEDALAIDTYLESIKGTQEQNEVSVLLRKYLEKECGEELEAGGLSATELAEAIVLE